MGNLVNSGIFCIQKCTNKKIKITNELGIYGFLVRTNRAIGLLHTDC